MKAKFSPLKILDFKLLNSVFQYVPMNNEEDFGLEEYFDQYHVDIDFAFQANNQGFIQLMVKTAINQIKNPLPGYQLFAEGVGVFDIEGEETLDKKTLHNLKFYSSLNMMINNLRNIIYQQTTLGTFGSYLLPPIDIVDLHNQKMANMKMKKK